jgi:hypothetical protein
MAILDLKDDPHLKILRPLVEAYDAILRWDIGIFDRWASPLHSYDVLAELGETKGMTAVELSNSTLLAKASLTGIIDRSIQRAAKTFRDQARDHRNTSQYPTLQNQCLTLRDYLQELRSGIIFS